MRARCHQAEEGRGCLRGARGWARVTEEARCKGWAVQLGTSSGHTRHCDQDEKPRSVFSESGGGLRGEVQVETSGGVGCGVGWEVRGSWELITECKGNRGDFEKSFKSHC